MPSEFAVFDEILEGCQVIGTDWTYLYVNEAAARHGRLSRPELVGRRMTDLYPGIDETPMFAALRRCMDTGVGETFDNAFTFPDGSTGWFELRVQRIPSGVFVLSMDVTRRVRAEQTMARQVTRLQSLRAIDLAILAHSDSPAALRTVLIETLRQPDTACAAIYLRHGLDIELADSVGIAIGPDSDVPSAVDQAARYEAGQIVATAQDLPMEWRRAGLTQMCAVPLPSKNGVLGVLVAGSRSDLFGEDEECVQFLDALAGQASMAIEAHQAFLHLEHAHRDLAAAYDSTLEGWAHALDLRDRETGDHTRRVCDAVLELGARAGMSAEELVHVKRGAILHDIGKMALSDAVLLKPGRLTDEERREIERHPTVAMDMLSRIGYLREALDIPYCHHERWDGAGYPRGLRGTEIPLAARLFAVVDVWDALCSDRPYRPAWTPADALAHIRSLAGTHFDPSAVDLFLQVKAVE